jgi:hypothetical protein
VQDRFKASVDYAKVAIKDPAVKQMYGERAQRNQSAFNVAFKDANNAPKVLAILLDGYAGVPGNVIVVRAFDDFKVISVKVSIHDANDTLIEEGAAVLNIAGLWTYAVTQNNPNVIGSKIKAVALDIPGNEGSLEVIV